MLQLKFRYEEGIHFAEGFDFGYTVISEGKGFRLEIWDGDNHLLSAFRYSLNEIYIIANRHHNIIYGTH